MDRSELEIGSLRKSERVGGLLYLAFYLFGLERLALLIARWIGADLSQKTILVPLNLICIAFSAAVLGAIFLRYLTDQFRRITDRGWAMFADLFLGYMVYYGLSHVAAILAGLLLTVFNVEYANLNQEVVEYLNDQQPWAAILIACVLAPLTEELLFRGLIFCGLRRRSRLLAYAVSMLGFSLLHVMGAIPYQPVVLSVVNLILYLPAGFALAWVYERSGSIWASIFLHAAINVISLLLAR